MELIDKDALVAGIKKLHGNPFYRMAIKDVLSILDSLEVKEVDLEKENFIKKEIGYIKGYRENAIIIVGRVYELIDDSESDACQRCALLMKCRCSVECLCMLLFECENVIYKRFEERKL